MKCNVAVAEGINDETVLPEPVQEARRGGEGGTLQAQLDALDAELHDAETYLKLTVLSMRRGGGFRSRY